MTTVQTNVQGSPCALDPIIAVGAAHNAAVTHNSQHVRAFDDKTRIKRGVSVVTCADALTGGIALVRPRAIVSAIIIANFG
jgi:hypothetical protein